MKIGEITEVGVVEGALFGVEVEVEGAGLPEAPPGFHSENDGSLRGGREYIFNTPKTLVEAKTALKELEVALAHPETRVNFSFRTSVHVHMNVSDLERGEMFRVLYTMLLFEPAFLQFSGEERRHNRFCLSSMDADGFLLDVRDMYRSFSEEAFYNAVRQFNEENHKYSAINLACLNTFGTIELRTMRGTADSTLLGTYLEVLNSIRAWAIQQESISSIYQKVLGGSAYEFAFEVLGVNALFLNYPNLEEEMALQASLTIDLPFAHGG